MRKNDNFKDVTPQGASNIGDLAYGRRLGTVGSGKGDFPGEWNEDTLECRNQPIVSYVTVEPRDEKLYEDIKRPSSSMKKINNTPQFKNEILKKFQNYSSKLRFNLSVLKVGKDTFKTQQI